MIGEFNEPVLGGGGDHASSAPRLARAIRELQDFRRAALGADLDAARRNIPPGASGLQIFQLTGLYSLGFLGLEPLPADPIIDDLGRVLDDDYPSEPKETERAVDDLESTL